MHSLQLAVRAVLAHRRTSAPALIMLSAGLGVAVALVTVVNAVFLRPLPYPSPDRLLFLHAAYPGGSDADQANFSYPDFDDLRRASASFDALAAHSDFARAAIDAHDGPAQVQLNFIEGPYFAILGATAARGRAFTAEEMRTGAPVTVLSHGAWRRIFGSDPAIVGRTVRLNGVPCEVVGVIDARFQDLGERDGRTVDAWVPVHFAPHIVSNFAPASRTGRLLWGVGRLKAGAGPADAAREVRAAGERLEQAHPDTNRGFGLRAVPLGAIFFVDLRAPLTMLVAGAAMLLAIVCCNVSLLLLARGAARQREMAVRIALGASRLGIVRQLLLESLVLGAAAGAASVGIGYVCVRTLLASGRVTLPAFVQPGVDPTVMLAAGALALATACGAAIVPALAGWRLGERFRLTGGGSWSVVHRSRAQLVFVVAQIGAAILLVTAAGAMATSLTRLSSAGLGFDGDRLLTMRLDLPAARYGDPGLRARFGERVRERLAALPDVRSVTLWGPGVPGRATWVSFVAPIERPIESPDDFQMVWRHSVNPGGLRDVGIQVVEGRDFGPEDRLDAVPVAIVGRTVARELWPDGAAIGKRMRTGQAAASPVVTIVGIADDMSMRGRFRFDDLDPRRIPQRDVYYPYAQRPNSGLVLLVRGRGDMERAAASVRVALRHIDPALPAYDIQTVEQILREEENGVRLAAVLLTGFGILALVMAMFGLYSLLSFVVSSRTREVGLRRALGAPRHRVLLGIAAEGMSLSAAGIITGLIPLAALGRRAGHLLYETSPFDATAVGLACAAVLATAAAASVLPAYRAASVDPAVALRND